MIRIYVNIATVTDASEWNKSSAQEADSRMIILKHGSEHATLLSPLQGMVPLCSRGDMQLLSFCARSLEAWTTSYTIPSSLPDCSLSEPATL